MRSILPPWKARATDLDIGIASLAPQPAVEAADVTRQATYSWQWLGVVGLIAVSGLYVIAIANTGARFEAAWAEPLFWVGLLALITPITLRLAAPSVPRTERLGLVTLLGLGLYLVKVLHSPLGFTYFDEFLHWRTYQDIVTTNELFTKNLLLPVSAQYPPLEIVTVALTALTGLPVFAAGVLVIGVVRVIFVLALFLFFERLSSSTQVASIASVLYMANPNFVFFNAMFKYESMALALLAVVLYTLARREGTLHTASLLRLSLVAGLTLVTVVMTHHLTAFALTAFLGLWVICGWVIRRYTATGSGPLDMLVLAVVTNLFWMSFVATRVIEYLGPLLSSAATEFVNLVAGRPEAPRQLFVSATGVAPLWERAVGLGSVALILLGLPFGLWFLWRRYRSQSAVVAMGIAALGYPVSLLLRLSGKSWEIGFRASEFLFMAVGFVIALGVVHYGLPGRWQRGRVLLFAVAVAIIFVGGIINGWTRQWRLPGPYLPAQDTRSIEPQGIEAAEWARIYLGPDNVIAADRTNTVLIATYGSQYVRTTLSGSEDPGWVMYAQYFGTGQRELLQRERIQYFVIDRRLLAAPERAARYYRDVPLQVAFYKFDHTPQVNRIFDSGAIQVYDVGGLVDGR